MEKGDVASGDGSEEQRVLRAAAAHDLEALRRVLQTASASVQDPVTLRTPLHAAIASCAPDEHSRLQNGAAEAAAVKREQNDGRQASTGVDDARLERAAETLKLLLLNGAIWNDVDAAGETPGCLAWRLGLRELYEILVEAGVRAELLLGRLDAFQPLGGDGDGDWDEAAGEADDEEIDMDAELARLDEIARAEADRDALTADDACVEIGSATATATDGGAAANGALVRPAASAGDDPSTLNPQYLSSALSITGGRILDADANAVMMDWEADLMQRTASLLLPTSGLKVLNVGFGMGIFDTFVQRNHGPAAHHIVEAHPDVLADMQAKGWWSGAAAGLDASHSNANAAATAAQWKNVTVHAGTWQEMLPRLVERNLTFDAIFFDTFAEDYAAFRDFFSEHVIALLAPGGRWSFFHGMGADRQVCYDVYTRVAELDLFSAGFDVEWTQIDAPAADWGGVRRKYFSLQTYRLPLCRFIA